MGVIYGLVIRILGGITQLESAFHIYSITFIWITPIIIGLCPIVFPSNALYKSKTKLFFYPIITIVLFLITALITRIEDMVCLLIIGLPFLVGAGLVGLLMGTIIKKRINNKKLYSILLIPFILNPIENILPNKREVYTTSATIIIDQSKEVIFPNILEVPYISDEEYTNGFYQHIGIPRPIHAKIVKQDKQYYRIGYFTDGLELHEYISEIKPLEFVNFKIDLTQSKLRNTPTDQHILKSKYFHFENISYRLTPISENKTKVSLHCEYSIESKMNFYANFWAKSIIHDFEVRLLKTIKHKLEK